MKFAYVGFEHIHVMDFYDHVNESPEHEIVGTYLSDYELEHSNNRVGEWVKKCGIKRTHNSYEEMLEKSGADAVAVASSFAQRGELIIKALRAGKHVITDKPICTKLSELEEIERLLKEKNLKLGCMLTMRYMGKVAAIRDIIQSGTLGKIHTICFGIQHPLLFEKREDWYFEEGKHGGSINDIAVHGMDIVRFATGLGLEKVLAARCWNALAPKETGFKDCAQFMVELTGGAGLLGDVSYSTPNGIGYAYPTRWEIFGDKGVIRFSLQNQPTEMYLGDDKECIIVEPKEVKNHFFEDFIKEIHGEKDVYLTTEEILLATRDSLIIQAFADKID